MLSSRHGVRFVMVYRPYYPGDQFTMMGYKQIPQLFFSCTLFTATLIIFGPIYLYLTNAGELWFGFDVVLGTVLVSGFLVWAVLMLLGRLLPRGLSDFYCALIFGLSLALYVQSYLLQGQYGLLDGKSVDWSGYGSEVLINAAAWAACLLFPFVIYKLKPAIFPQMIRKVTLLLIGIQLVVTFFLIFNVSWRKDSTYYLSEKHLYSLSNEKNIVVFILDAFDKFFFDDLLAGDDSLPSAFRDFTYYEDTVGIYPTTRGAIPFILTGIPSYNEIPYRQYLSKAYSETPLYESIRNNGYQAGIYAIHNFVDAKFIENNQDIITNASSGRPKINSLVSFARELYLFTAMRFSPLALKKYLWVPVNRFDNLQGDYDSGDTLYAVTHHTDLKFYSHLTEGINVYESGNEARPWFKVYHLLGPHGPIAYDEKLQPVNNENDDVTRPLLLKQARGSLKIVEEFVRQLKKNGLYDQTAIIVMADHGIASPSPLLMVKEFNADSPFEISSVPVSYFDLPPSLLNYVAGRPGHLKDWVPRHEYDRLYLFYNLAHNDWFSDYMPMMTEYLIKGPAKERRYERSGATYPPGGRRMDENLLYEVSFTVDDGLPVWRWPGLSAPEKSHTWSIGGSTTIDLVLNRQPKRDVRVDLKLLTFYKGPGNKQEIIISANGRFIQRRVIASEDDLDIIFTVPKDIIEDRRLNLKLEYPDAVAPSAVSDSSDPRVLAVAFNRLAVYEQEGERAQPPVYGLGRRLSFASNIEPSYYFTLGLSGAEESHTWSEGCESIIDMTLDRQPRKDLSVDIQLLMFYKGIKNVQEVIISANGGFIERRVLSSDNDLDIRFTIPKELFTDRELKLKLEYPDAVAPSAVSDSADMRVLGVAFKSMVIDEQ
ncbi:hypothetical protein C4J81_19300 (plasmid) [Deltaproteobacteria bacterium Smac51]|nr:hypothetical protein C4J81_19300 [Deltaproteobacteria bacterium Smac51]